MRHLRGMAVLAFLIALAACSEDKTMPTKASATPPDFDKEWNYSAPAETRKSFLTLLESAGDSASLAWQLELKTQIARTHSLAGEFAEAHKILDAIEPAIVGDMARVRIRYLLERGRALNSSGEVETARPFFVEAYELAKTTVEDFYTVDAAHMVAITLAEPAEANRWNLIGLDHARQSEDDRARGWVGSLTNNMGWTAFDEGRLDEALSLFEESRDNFLSRNLPDRARIARWSIARVKREQGNIEEALAMQLEIRDENEAAGQPDGYNFEELGELWLLRQKPDEAAANFARAFEMLSQVNWFARNEPKRLARIRDLSSENSTPR